MRKGAVLEKQQQKNQSLLQLGRNQ